MTSLDLTTMNIPNNAPKVTKELIEQKIKDVRYTVLDGTVTICTIEMHNGFTFRGESAVVNKENYDQEIGQRIAYNETFNKIWPYEGYLLKELQADKTRYVQYKHYTGHIVDYIGNAELEADKSPMVVYRHDGQILVRPVEEFYGTVLYEGMTLPRFTLHVQ